MVLATSGLHFESPGAPRCSIFWFWHSFCRIYENLRKTQVFLKFLVDSIENPQGGITAAPPLSEISANGLKPQKLSDRRWASCRLARSRQDFGNSWRFLAILGFFGASSPGLSKTSPGAFKIEPGTLQDEPPDLQNRAPRPPRRAPGLQKSSPEASKTAFLKDLYLKKAQVGARRNFFFDFWPTWLQFH